MSLGLDQGQPVSSLHGRDAIQAFMKDTGHRPRNVHVIQVDAQNSLHGGLLVVVLGTMQFDDEHTPRRFTQTFFLAPQPSGYFVMNDILRFEQPVLTTSYSIPADTTSYSIPADTTSYSIPADTTSYSIPATTSDTNTTTAPSSYQPSSNTTADCTDTKNTTVDISDLHLTAFVRDLPPDVTVNELMQLFAHASFPPVSIDLASTKRFAYIKFATADIMQQAIKRQYTLRGTLLTPVQRRIFSRRSSMMPRKPDRRFSRVSRSTHTQ